jgi:ethanolamine utilization protein EutQ (cupin superfamily)
MARAPTLIESPTIVQALGHPPKKIEEFVGRVNSGHTGVSVARMTSPEGWHEPGQTPEFDELTLVLGGKLRVEWAEGAVEVGAGQAVVTHAGQWVRYSTPFVGGAQYVAICLPAFAPDLAHRDP